ncbi:helix-turn-helix domain-containing protein [Rhizobium sp. Root482]|uniref:helix-turn-helix domain-containing protein n=1 Tax=Rhizobium sp. Root482 TaxID=1736543 RepID=UPI0006FFF898|nr:helix-turn-helix domain-containing protein [Rhizobium sp. Root482]KQY27193.1 hypothetical protein ASD31_03140 [Rhizobium sp. Root482]
MSFDATNWAIKQRGMKPATKIVLWHLCDRFHPDHGCFPSQDTLANDCEMSRSTLNVHLDALEGSGLILRIQSRRAGSKQQERTKYHFPFEPDFAVKRAQKPCPETGHGAADAVSGNDEKPCPENGESRVRNPDSNPVREPVREPVKERGRGREGDEDRSAIPGTAEFRKRVQRFLSGDGYQGGEWPKWANGTTIDYITRHFAALSESNRKVAEERRDAFLAKSALDGGKVMGAGNYFRDLAWEALSERDVATYAVKRGPGSAPVVPDNWAKAYGPAHAAVLFRILCAGPERPDLAPETGVWFSSHYRTAWPRLMAFKQQTDLRGGLLIEPDDMLMSEAMGFIARENPLFAAWQGELRRRKLPELHVPDGMRGHYFPKVSEGERDLEMAVSDALDRFSQDTLQQRGKGHDDAA